MSSPHWYYWTGASAVIISGYNDMINAHFKKPRSEMNMVNVLLNLYKQLMAKIQEDNNGFILFPLTLLFD